MIRIDKRGVISYHAEEGELCEIESAKILPFLTDEVELRDGLRIRDLFMVFSHYQQLAEIFPYSFRYLNIMNEQPRIGCASYDYDFIGVSKEYCAEFRNYPNKEASVPIMSAAMVCMGYKGGERADISHVPLRCLLDMPVRLMESDTGVVAKDPSSGKACTVKDVNYLLFDLLMAVDNELMLFGSEEEKEGYGTEEGRRDGVGEGIPIKKDQMQLFS